MYALALLSQMLTAEGDVADKYTKLLGDPSYSGCSTMIESRSAIDAGEGTLGVLFCKPEDAQ